MMNRYDIELSNFRKRATKSGGKFSDQSMKASVSAGIFNDKFGDFLNLSLKIPETDSNCFVQT